MQRKSAHHIIDDSSHGSIWGTSKVNALSVWTINDQKKLHSINDLYLRSLDYHCNVHTKETTLFVANQMARSTDEMNDPVDSTAILANVITFSTDKSKRLLQSMHYLQLRGFCRNLLTLEGVTEEASIPAPTSPHQANQTLPKDNYWFHLRDLKGLDVLASHLKMHDLIYTGFHDLRAYPTMIPTGNEILITHVICSLEDLEFRMHKLFIYVRDRVIITFEVELFPDLEDILEDQSADVLESMLDDMKLNRSSSVTSKGEAVVNPLAPVDVENPEENNRSTPAAPTIPHLSKVTDRLMQRFFQHATRLKQKVLEMGVMYLVYEICMQSLAFYDGSIEYVASSLAYFNRIVNLNLLHGERMAIMKKIHLLSAGINLLKKLMEDCAENFGKLAQLESATSYGMLPPSNHHMMHNHLLSSSSPHSPHSSHFPSLKRLGSGNHSSRIITFLNDTHILYLTDVNDSYLFKCKAIQKQADEIIRLETELDARIQLRATNASTMLSLIATTFLPLTFFSGVFGMNFTVDGGYTMELLNATYGVDVFIALCILSAFFSIVFFSYQGWLEFGIFAKLYRAMNSSEKIDDIKNGESYDEEAAQKAEEEENRRRAESMQMRNSYALFSGRATSGSTASTGGWEQGISLFGIQNLYPALGNTSNTSSSNVREEVIEFYRQHNPSKLSSVDSILANYRGKERELLRKLHKQYDIPL